MQQTVETDDGEVQIFENTQHAQMADHRQSTPELPPSALFPQQQTKAVAHHHADQQQRQQPYPAKGIEHQTDNAQQGVFCSLAGCKMVQQHHRRQKHK